MRLAEPHWITDFRHALLGIDRFMAGASMVILLGLVFGQVIARNLLNTSIPHADIVSRYMVLYVTFFGAALAVESGKHIRIDVVGACLPVEKMARLQGPLNLMCALICALLAHAAMRFWHDDWQYIADHERWSSVLALITPFGFSLLTLHFLLGGLFRPKPEPESEEIAS